MFRAAGQASGSHSERNSDDADADFIRAKRRGGCLLSRVQRLAGNFKTCRGRRNHLDELHVRQNRIAEVRETAHVRHRDLDAVNAVRQIIRHDKTHAIMHAAIANRDGGSVDYFRERRLDVAHHMRVHLAHDRARRLRGETDLRVRADEIDPFEHHRLSSLDLGHARSPTRPARASTSRASGPCRRRP